MKLISIYPRKDRGGIYYADFKVNNKSSLQKISLHTKNKEEAHIEWGKFCN